MKGKGKVHFPASLFHIGRFCPDRGVCEVDSGTGIGHCIVRQYLSVASKSYNGVCGF